MPALDSKQERTDKENRQLLFDVCMMRGGGWGKFLSEASLRDGDRIYCTPDYTYGLNDPQRDFADMTLDDIIVYTVEGKTVDGKQARELYLPAAKYRVGLYTKFFNTYPEYKGIVHMHNAPYIGAFCAAGVPFRPLDGLTQNYCGWFEIPVLDHPAYSMGLDLPERFNDVVVEGLRERKVCLIRKHGAFVAGANIKEAMNRAELLESGAQTTLLAIQLRNYSELVEEHKKIWEITYPGGLYGPLSKVPYFGLRKIPGSQDSENSAAATATGKTKKR